MADFKQFLPLLLEIEGGFVSHPADPGGPTNKGITFAVFQQWAKALLNLEPTLENLKALTDEQAGTLYKKLYWDRVYGDDIKMQWLANIVCDFCVQNPYQAATILQRVINQHGCEPPLKIDGSIGPQTMAALNRVSHPIVYQMYHEARTHYYESLKDKYPHFIKGWRNRMKRFPKGNGDKQ